MKINLAILTTLVLLTVLWTMRADNVRQNHVETAVTAATDFSYTTMEGVQSSLYAQEGKVVLLHFWASWCAPCLVEFPALLDLAVSEHNNLIVLAVSTDKKKSDIDKFLKKLKKDIPANVQIIQDADQRISEKLYKTTKLPETYVITPSLTVAEKIIGPQENWDSVAWRQKISSLSP